MRAKVGVSLIGTPDGFEAASIGASQSVSMGHKVDLDNSVINILPNTDILVVRRDMEGPRSQTYVTYYRFAKEIKTFRTGSFYGCSILFENFVPTRIAFAFNLLTELADRVSQACIDPDENRFHSHIEPALLDNLKDDGRVLDPVTYVSGDIRTPGRIYDRKCFLQLDRSVRDYENFLYEALLGNREAPTGLPGYRFVYTSEHDAVIEEVRLRRGLKIETLTSLRERYLLESGAHEEEPQAQTRNEHAEIARGASAGGDPRGHDPGPSAQAGGLVPTKEPAREVNRHQETGRGWGAEAAEGSQFGKSSRVVVDIDQGSTHEEGAAARADESDASFGALARQFQKTYKANRGLFLLLVLIILGGLLGAVLVRSGIWSYLTGYSLSSRAAPIYYDGCRKERGDISDFSAPTQKCQPEYVADEFERQLQRCTAYEDHLKALRREGGQTAVNNYRDKIRDDIRLSLEDPQLNQLLRTGSALSLNRKISAGFVVALNFKGSNNCINEILNNPQSEFTWTRTAPTPTPLPVVEASPQIEKDRTQPPAQQAKQQTSTTAPNKPPGPSGAVAGATPAPKPIASPATVQPDAANQNSSAFTGSIRGDTNSQPAPKPTPTPVQAQPGNTNNKVQATPTQEPKKQLKRRKGKKG